MEMEKKTQLVIIVDIGIKNPSLSLLGIFLIFLEIYRDVRFF